MSQVATSALREVFSDPTTAPAGLVGGTQRGSERIALAGGVCGSEGRRISVDTVFDIASVTKVVATTCALHRLAVRGEIDLDDELTRYLPDSPCAPGTTLATLAYHRAGLWEWQPLYLAGEPLCALRELPLRYRPDTERHYSDLGFMLLGRVVAHVMGEPLDLALADLVTEPLGLYHTSFGPAATQVAASSHGDRVEQQMVATGEPYPVLCNDAGFKWREHELVGEANDGNCFHAFGGVSGHAGLFSTADDLLTLGASLSRAEPALWGTGVFERITSDGPDAGQAFGWRSWPVTYLGRPNTLLWHPGFTGCALGFIPHSDFALVLLSNRLLAPKPTETRTLWERAAAAVEGLELGPNPEGTIR